MNSFTKKFLDNMSLPLGTSWLLGECMEAKGKQQFWDQKKPEVLRALKDLAMIQSAESSNRIEGIEIEHRRLEPLVLGQANPKNRPEEEILGYRHALELIHKHSNNLKIESKTIQKLHCLSQEGAGDAGRWKNKDNEIIEFDQRGQRSVRFVPLEAKLTTQAMKQLCLGFKDEIKNERQSGLILTALFILDFLCIHPFRDGNGRVSRLLTLLLLYQQEIQVGRFISLERIVEENKTDYYEALKKSSQGWHKSQHDPLPWINFFLSTLRIAYKELSAQVEISQNFHGAKNDIIEKIILDQIGYFTLRELKLQCPNISLQMIKKVLGDIKKSKKIILTGRGRSARWKNR